MVRRRSRVKRQLAALGLLVILLVLLELNRFLPGGWPGGGDLGGYRVRTEAETDRSRLRPPVGAPTPWPREGVTVVLRVPSDDRPDPTSVGVDLPGGEESEVDAQGRALLEDPRVVEYGFVVRADGREVRHGAAVPEGTDPWIVHLPPRLPAPPPVGAELELLLVGAEDGRPLAGAAIRVQGPGGGAEEVTDPGGRARIGPLAGRVLVGLEAAGRRSQQRWVHPGLPSPVRIALPLAPEADLSFADAEDGTPIVPERLRLRSADGAVLWEQSGVLGTTRLTTEHDADPTRMFLEVWHAAYPVVLVPLAETRGAVQLPRGRLLEIEARDERSQRLFGEAITARYEPVLLGSGRHRLTEPFEVEVSGEGRVVLPSDREARVLVDAAHSHPQALRITPDEPPGPRVVKLEPGVILPVRVTAAGGRAIGGAEVVVVGSTGGLRVRRSGRTTAEGRVRIPQLPRGSVEVYAHAPGMAWAVAIADLDASRDETVLQLIPGAALRFVVETPLGLPLAGVRVHLLPEDASSAGDVVPPGSRPTRTDRDGTLVVPDLPARPYRVRFTRPDRREVVLRRIVPGRGVHFVTLLPR